MIRRSRPPVDQHSGLTAADLQQLAEATVFHRRRVALADAMLPNCRAPVVSSAIPLAAALDQLLRHFDREAV